MSVLERVDERALAVGGDDESDVYPDDREWVNACIRRVRGELAPEETAVNEIPLPPQEHVTPARRQACPGPAPAPVRGTFTHPRRDPRPARPRASEFRKESLAVP
ncbi:hypothetical protein ACFQ6N_01590 [Kitasatospora sp. NPDC056446]|uniref:hypothetical protein n=1 Tax=Kitasatospora sp. NPDC056446 TaxID=3345819 RepID=UPI00369C20DE